MKIIKQHDQRDCGAACLAMIAAHYGLKMPISRFRELTKTDRTGVNLYGLTDGASRIGLEAAALSGSFQELTEGIESGEITFPFVAHTVTEGAMLHYIVVFSYKNGVFTVGDPARGKLRLNAGEFAGIWTGYIVTFQKGEDFKVGNYTRGGFVKFFRFLKGQYSKLAWVLILSLIIAAVGIMGTFVFELVIDSFATETQEESGEVQTDDGHDHDHDDADADAHEEEQSPTVFDKIFDAVERYSFQWVFIALLFLYLLQAGIQYIRGYLIIAMSRKIDIQLSLSYYNHIVDLPVSSIAVRQTGEYLSRFSDTDTIRTAISGATITLMMDTLMVIGCGCVLYLENPLLFCVSLIMVALYAVVVLIYRRPVERSNRAVMESGAMLQSYFKESIDGIETVKAACAGEQVKDTTTAKYTRFIGCNVKNSLLSLSQDTIAGAIELMGTVVILWIGFGMVKNGTVTLGSLLTFYALMAYFTTPIKNLIELQPTIQGAIIAADRLNDVLDLSPETDESGDVIENPGRWELKNVDFRYGNRELLLKNVSMHIERGEKIAIVGESGSGKTTLVKMLMRFYTPEAGEVLIDGKNVNTLELTGLRGSIAYVNQNTFLFSDTIINNLRLGCPEATDEEIYEACRVSCADGFIKALPLGYDTPLDENGANLSGGQRQRLAIARALLKKPKLLILDEATSNLDTITESGIKNTIFHLDSDMTCIIIAHRLQTVRGCDRIYVMDDGEIAESGTFDRLMHSGGKFASLWESQ